MSGGVICPQNSMDTLSWTFGLVSPAHWPGKALGGGPGSEAECAILSPHRASAGQGCVNTKCTGMLDTGKWAYLGLVGSKGE